MKRVLVLTGGGGMGSYQAGVMLALHEKGIRFDAVVGNSIGALNGMMLATGQMDDLFNVWTRDVAGLNLLTDQKRFRQIISNRVAGRKFEIPLVVNTLELVPGNILTYILQDYPDGAVNILHAASAVPGYFKPVNGMVDAGLTHIVPPAVSVRRALVRIKAMTEHELYIISCRESDTPTYTKKNRVADVARVADLVLDRISINGMQQLFETFHVAAVYQPEIASSPTDFRVTTIRSQLINGVQTANKTYSD